MQEVLKSLVVEPLIMKRQYELLDALIECDEAKNIIIKYQTNFTKMKAGRHNIFDYIPKFKKVAMVASIDGPLVEILNICEEEQIGMR